MALMQGIYPFSTKDKGPQQYAIAGVSANRETEELEARIIYTARSADTLGRLTGISYFSAAHGAPINYDAVPEAVSRIAPGATPLSPQERQDFVEEFIRHSMPR